MASKKLLVGIFLVGGVALFTVGLFLIGSRKQAFARHFEIYTEFSNLSQLQSGAKVRVSGMDAGEVVGMEVPKRPSSRFRLKLKIEEKLHRIVRQDSVASIQTEGLVGNKYLDVAKGSDHSPECPTGGTIPSKEPFDWSNLMEQGSDLIKTTRASIEDVRNNANQALQAFTKTGTDADEMVVSIRGDVKQITAKATRITDNMSQILAGIREGRGPAGKLLNDDALSARIDRTSSNFEQASANVNDIVTDFQQRALLAKAETTLENTRQMTDQLNRAVNTFLANSSGGQNTAAGLREMVTSARTAMSNLADDSEALKHNFLLRGFFKRRGFYNLAELTPAQYVNTKFIKSASAVRAWLAASDLFVLRPEGGEEISPQGRAAIHEAMARFVKDLPNRPLMIEGYSNQGLAQERYIRSRQRAAAVQEYLQTEFHLNGKLTGIMPLGDSAPPGVDKTTWDGVSLVMLRREP